MTKTATQKLGLLLAGLALSFGAATIAHAYDQLEIEVDVLSDTTVIEVTVDDEDFGPYTYVTTDLDEAYQSLIDEEDLADLELTLEDVTAAATVTDEDGGDDADDADDSDDDDADDSDDDDADGDNGNVCTKSRGIGFGVMTKCADENVKELKKDKEFRFEYKEAWKSYGKTTDRTELQNQLRELLLMVIQLLQQQLAAQQGS